jgi:integrase
LEAPIALQQKASIRLLARLLAPESLSPVTRVPGIIERTSDLSRERRLWEDTVLTKVDVELTQVVHAYVFGELLERTERAVIRTLETQRVDAKGSIRVSKGKIQVNTWAGCSRMLRRLVAYCLERQITAVSQLLAVDEHGMTVLDRYIEDSLIRGHTSVIDGFRSVVRNWLEWYEAIYHVSINLKRIFPPLKNRPTRTFGKILHLSSMHLLILTLLDRQTPFIDENDLLQYRCRRAVLIQIATGVRIESACLLLQDCLTEYDGRYWLRFHKTKKGKEHVVEVKEDVATWINEALRVSAKREIAALWGQTAVADGLTRKRVFAEYPLHSSWVRTGRPSTGSPPT